MVIVLTSHYEQTSISHKLASLLRYEPHPKLFIVKNVPGKTQAEVKEKLKKAIAESGEPDIKRSGMYTVGQWIDLWYEIYAKPGIRESTAVYDKMFIDTHATNKVQEQAAAKMGNLLKQAL